MTQPISLHQDNAEAVPQLPVDHLGMLATNGFYSPLFRELVERLSKDGSARKRRLDLTSPDIIELMRDYDAAVSAWPVMINRELTASFDEFTHAFPRIMSKAISGYFGNDTQRFAKYMNVPGLLLDLINGTPIDTGQLLIRYDAVFSNNTFKIVEVNAGSMIGGWQLDLLEQDFRALTQSLIDSSRWSLSYRGVMHSMLKALVSVLMRAFAAPRGNVLFFIDSHAFVEHRQYELFCKLLQSMFREIARSRLPSGKLLFFSNLEDLEFPVDGTVGFRGERVECLVLNLPVGVAMSNGVAMKLLSSFLAGKVVYPDSPLHSIFGNKLGLALLHEPELAALFTSDEKRLIDAHIPWAARATSAQVVRNGRHEPLELLLRAGKDDFVLKKAQSSKGLDVIIGRCTDAATWDAAIAAACQDDGWLVQEYCAPDRVIAYEPDVGFRPFEFVWGFFHFDNSYGGAFIRGVPLTDGAASEASGGVINSARGAREFAVFEAERKMQRILL